MIRNKYFIAGSAFLSWMLFFDRNDLMSQYEYSTQLNKLQAEKKFYLKESEKDETGLEIPPSAKKQALIDQLEQQLLDAMAAQVQSYGLGVLDVTE